MFWLCQSIHATSPEGTQAPESFQCDSRLVASVKTVEKFALRLAIVQKAMAYLMYSSLIVRILVGAMAIHSVHWSRLCFLRDEGSELNDTVYSRFIAQVSLSVIGWNIPLRGSVSVSANEYACCECFSNCGICIVNVSELKEYLRSALETRLTTQRPPLSFFLRWSAAHAKHYNFKNCNISAVYVVLR